MTDLADRRAAGEARTIRTRASRNRAELTRALADATDFASAQRLHERLSEQPRAMSLTTVYRLLHALVESGSVDVIRDETGERLYRARPDGEHRHYLVCRACGRSVAVDSAPVERWADRVGGPMGFADVQHVVELTGICRRCVEPGS